MQFEGAAAAAREAGCKLMMRFDGGLPDLGGSRLDCADGLRVYGGIAVSGRHEGEVSGLDGPRRPGCFLVCEDLFKYRGRVLLNEGHVPIVRPTEVFAGSPRALSEAGAPPGGIVVTLPASVEWFDYEKELEAVRDGSQQMHFRVPSLPRVKAGDPCYVVHRGHVRGWMAVSGTKRGGFDCTTTGRRWDGNFVSRSGPFHPIEPVPMRGFQGFRYASGTPVSPKFREGPAHMPIVLPEDEEPPLTLAEAASLLVDAAAADEGRHTPASLAEGAGAAFARLLAERAGLGDGDYAVPGKKKLRIDDEKHVKLAWDMVDRTGGLSPKERSAARAAITARAHKLGLDTAGWNKVKMKKAAKGKALDEDGEEGEGAAGAPDASANADVSMGEAAALVGELAADSGAAEADVRAAVEEAASGAAAFAPDGPMAAALALAEAASRSGMGPRQTAILAGMAVMSFNEVGGLMSWVRRMATGLDQGALAEVRKEMAAGVKTAARRDELVSHVGKLIGEAEASRHSQEGRKPGMLAAMKRNQSTGAIGRYINALEKVRGELRSMKLRG
jgi:hypothetical protein